MAKSVILWIYLTYCCYFLQSVCTGTTYTSKACYGTDIYCARHDLSCNSSKKIALYDAYFTNNKDCVAGVSSCNTVKPDNVTEDGYHGFKKNEMVSLCKICSTKSQCEFPGPRRGASRTFSVVKYQCIEATDPFNVTCETLEPTTEWKESTRTASTHKSRSTGTTDNTNNVAGEAGRNTGAIAGGVVATVLVVLTLTLVSVWIIRHRRSKSAVEERTAPMSMDAKHDMTYSLAGKIPQNNYHEIQDLKTHNSDYDYATLDSMVLPSTYLTIEPAGKLTANDNSTARTAEGDYDHIGDKPSLQTSDYDTAASVAQPGDIREDSYGYNHFQEKANTQTHQNDYDTAASATRAVANISTTERNTYEDDYDHCQRGTNASETVSSPYDTTSGIEDNSDYCVAGQME